MNSAAWLLFIAILVAAFVAGFVKQFLARRAPGRNITVYYLSAITDGQTKMSPIGTIPRLLTDYEKTIRKKHRPKGATYINETLAGVSVILFWNITRIDAIGFLREDEAIAFPGFTRIPLEDLAKFDSVLRHFPR